MDNLKVKKRSSHRSMSNQVYSVRVDHNNHKDNTNSILDDLARSDTTENNIKEEQNLSDLYENSIGESTDIIRNEIAPRISNAEYKPQAVNKGPLFASSSSVAASTNPSTHRDSFPMDRFTILDEPYLTNHYETTFGNSDRTRNKDIISINNARTLSNQEASPNPYTHSIARNIAHRDQSSSQLGIILVAIWPIAILLLGIIFYAWFYRNKRMRAKSCIETQLTALVPLCCKTKQQDLAKSQTDDVTGEMTSETVSESLNQNHGCDGEQKQLVDHRVPTTSEFPNSIRAQQFKQQVTSGGRSSLDEEIITHVDTELVSGDQKSAKLSTMVILKKKLAQNTFYVAINPKKPKSKLRLKLAGLRRFVDVEALEVKQREMKLDFCHRIWHNRIIPQLSYLRKVLSSHISKNEFEMKTKEQVYNDDKENESHDDNINENSPHSNDESSSMKVSANNVTGITCSNQVYDAGELVEKLFYNEKKNNLAPGSLQTGAYLSPSPLINDGYSSLSGGSLFSPSPVEQHQASISACSCGLNRDRLAVAVISNLGVFDEASARSKSQGPSPSKLVADSQPYRPCCSVSPSALNSHPPERDTNICHQPQTIEHQHQQQDQKSRATAEFEQHNLPSLQSQFMRVNLCAGQLGEKNVRYNSHIKRQYENYYDDEREEAYQQLTASIGMEFGLGFSDHESTAQVASQLKYTTTSENIDDLLQCSRFGCQHHYTSAQHSYMRLGGDRQQVATQHEDTPNQVLLTSLCRYCQKNTTTNRQHMIDKCCRIKDCQVQTKPNQTTSCATRSHCNSASEYLSCINTSDGSFATSAMNYNSPAKNSCRSRLCNCQGNMSIHSFAPVTNILIQQASKTSPPIARPHSEIISQRDDHIMGNVPTSERPVKENQSNSAIEGHMGEEKDEILKDESSRSRQQFHTDSKETPTDLKPDLNRLCGNKWKMKRQLSKQERRSRESNFDRGQLLYRQARTMSVAGVDCQIAQIGSNPSNIMTPINTVALNGQHYKYSPLQHRASIASDCVWNQQNLSNHLRHFNGQNNMGLEQEQQQQSLSSPYRPSDSSLYELLNDPCSLAGNYSSSAGSSSGIGFSGSACTNTPTTSTFPCGYSFVSKGETLADFVSKTALLPTSYEHQLHYDLYKLNTRDQLASNSLCQTSACQSRKFSLPVQLESSIDESVLQNQSKLHRGDSSNFSSDCAHHSFYHHCHHCPDGSLTSNLQAFNQLESIQLAAGRQSNRMFDSSRRSSQTITRQSSFWLEDTTSIEQSIQSISTSVVAGEDASQIDENQCLAADTDSQCANVGSTMQIEEATEADLLADDAMRSKAIPTKSVQGSIVDSSGSVNDDPPTQQNSQNSDKKLPPESTKPVKDKSLSKYRALAHMRSRLSSSSTSSMTSSPSPDFGKPKDRILSLASKASGISKRHIVGSSTKRCSRSAGRSSILPRSNLSPRTSKHLFHGSGRQIRDESDDNYKSENELGSKTSIEQRKTLTDGHSCEQESDLNVDQEFLGKFKSDLIIINLCLELEYLI